MSAGELHHAAAQPHQLFANFLRRPADRRADLDDRLVQLRLHLPEEAVVVLEELRDVRLQLASLRVDDLVLFFDANR